MKDNYSNMEWKLLFISDNDYDIDCHDDHNDDNSVNKMMMILKMTWMVWRWWLFFYRW